MRRYRMKMGGEPVELVKVDDVLAMEAEIKRLQEAVDSLIALGKGENDEKEIRRELEHARKTNQVLEVAIRQLNEEKAHLKVEVDRLSHMLEDEMMGQDGTKEEADRLRELLSQIGSIAACAARK